MVADPTDDIEQIIRPINFSSQIYVSDDVSLTDMMGIGTSSFKTITETLNKEGIENHIIFSLQ